MNKKLLAVIFVLLVFGGIFAVSKLTQKPDDSSMGSVVDGRYFIGSGVSTSTNAAYLNGNASTTSQIIPVKEFDEVAVTLALTASSTTSSFNWKYEFSNNKVDWYGLINASSTDINHVQISSTTPTFYKITPSTTDTIFLKDNIKDINDDYMRITVQLGTVAQHGSVWGELRPIRRIGN
jgi:hypothetical protein